VQLKASEQLHVGPAKIKEMVLHQY